MCVQKYIKEKRQENRETVDKGDSVLNEAVRNLKEPNETVAITKQYEVLSKEETNG